MEDLTYAVTVTASDTADQPGGPFRALTCTTAGVAVIAPQAGGTAVSITLAVGVVWRGCGFVRVNSTGLTAAGVVAYK